MHQHRRRDDNDEPRPRLERAVESSVALAGSRLVTPVLLLVCITLIGWIGSGFNARLDEQGKDLVQVKTDLRVLGTRLDAQVIRQVDQNSKRLDTIEDRVQILERSVPTP